MDINVKDVLIRETALKFGISETLARSIVNHQFVMIKLHMSLNEIGELHLSRFGRIESNEGRVKYVRKNMEKNKEKKDKQQDNG